MRLRAETIERELADMVIGNAIKLGDWEDARSYLDDFPRAVGLKEILQYLKKIFSDLRKIERIYEKKDDINYWVSLNAFGSYIETIIQGGDVSIEFETVSLEIHHSLETLHSMISEYKQKRTDKKWDLDKLRKVVFKDANLIKEVRNLDSLIRRLLYPHIIE